MTEFFDEDDLKTFEGWLRYQAIDATALTREESETWPRVYEEVTAAAEASPNIGRMKFRSIPNEYRYAVAIRKGNDLWLTAWVKRTKTGNSLYLCRAGPRIEAQAAASAQ